MASDEYRTTIRWNQAARDRAGQLSEGLRERWGAESGMAEGNRAPGVFVRECLRPFLSGWLAHEFEDGRLIAVAAFDDEGELRAIPAAGRKRRVEKQLTDLPGGDPSHSSFRLTTEWKERIDAMKPEGLAFDAFILELARPFLEGYFGRLEIDARGELLAFTAHDTGGGRPRRFPVRAVTGEAKANPQFDEVGPAPRRGRAAKTAQA